MTDLARFDLQGTVAVVTGGGSGIGRAVAAEFSRRGARVLVTDVDDARAETVASEITAVGGTAVWQHLDVTQRDDFVAARARCLEELGRVDVVVNNVATMLSGRPEQIPAEEWSRLLDVNILGIVRSNEVFLPGLIEQGHGHVVNTASTNGIIVYSYDRTPYAASKAAVMMLSEQLFVYLRPYGVGVSCLAPAGVMTNIVEHMRPVGEQLPLRAPDFPIVTADVAGARVADAIESRAFLVLTADEVRDELRRAGDDLDAYLVEREASLHDEAHG
ncbi:MAG TPA: SDR family NAD(P)-dependent oxidoreductase [Acidimicrobiia bacterium]|jgi:NAD(P)-dependent dehydrogenase (short-subunit alcohol dehydrogenase family)